MKKKSMVCIATLAVAAIVTLGIWFTTRPELLGNMGDTYSVPATSTSAVSFSREKGDRIKFSFASKIISGDLDLVLYDSSGNVAYDLARASEMQTFFTPEKTDTYTLQAQYKDFTGNYRIAVYAAD